MSWSACRQCPDDDCIFFISILCTVFDVFALISFHFILECVFVVYFTSGSFPSDTKLRALHPSEPIHENCPVALFRRTARITSRTSWSEPKMIAPKMDRKHCKISLYRDSWPLQKAIKRVQFNANISCEQ